MIRWKCFLCDNIFSSKDKESFHDEAYEHLSQHKDEYIEVVEDE